MAAQEPSKLLVRVRSSSPAPPSTSPRLALRRGVAQSGSESGWGPEGRWFESSRTDYVDTSYPALGFRIPRTWLACHDRDLGARGEGLRYGRRARPGAQAALA